MTLKGNQKWAVLRHHLINDAASYNAEVTAHFGDTSQDTGRENAKNLCLIQSSDSERIALQRKEFFYYQVLKIQNKPTIIGKVKTDFDADVKYHPQVCIKFYQDIASVPQGGSRKDAQICWRIMTATSETITQQNINDLATLVYTKFFSPDLLSYTKGKYIAWYINPAQGLNLQIYCYDESTASTITNKLVTGLGFTWNDNYYKITKPSRNNMTQPPDITILGTKKKQNSWRQNILVKASYAFINIWNDSDVRIIVDKFGNQFYPILKQV